MKTIKYYMNTYTGSIDTYEGWYYENEEGETVNAVDEGTVTEIDPNEVMNLFKWDFTELLDKWETKTAKIELRQRTDNNEYVVIEEEEHGCYWKSFNDKTDALKYIEVEKC